MKKLKIIFAGLLLAMSAAGCGAEGSPTQTGAGRPIISGYRSVKAGAPGTHCAICSGAAISMKS